MILLLDHPIPSLESLMRCQRMKEAEYLLTERTALMPNDAQSWRRLASLYGRTGERLEVLI